MTLAFCNPVVWHKSLYTLVNAHTEPLHMGMPIPHCQCFDASSSVLCFNLLHFNSVTHWVTNLGMPVSSDFASIAFFSLDVARAHCWFVVWGFVLRLSFLLHHLNWFRNHWKPRWRSMVIPVNNWVNNWAMKRKFNLYMSCKYIWWFRGRISSTFSGSSWHISQYSFNCMIDRQCQCRFPTATDWDQLLPSASCMLAAQKPERAQEELRQTEAGNWIEIHPDQKRQPSIAALVEQLLPLCMFSFWIFKYHAALGAARKRHSEDSW